MKKTLVQLSLFTSLLMASLFNVANADDAAIKKSFDKMSMQIEEIKTSPIAGLRMVLTNGGVFYASEDGKYVLQGNIYDVSGTRPVNVTQKEFLTKLDALAKEMIVFKADNEKHVITVFTDPTCGYCIKLQANMAEYNKQGITIRYLAFPRQGMNSEEAKTLQSVWCSADQKTAFSKATKGEKVAPAKCNIDIARHYNLGVDLGVNGTPAIVYKEMVLPGYVEPVQLKKMLESYETNNK